MRAVLSAMLMAALGAGAAEAQSASTITKRHLRAQPPAATDRQLRDQMWSIFRREDRRTKKPPRRALDMVWNQTRPYATPTEGLCRYDIVILNFAPDGATAKPDADTPTRAYGIEASAKFRFVRPPKADGDSDGDANPRRRECTSIDTDKVDFFDAPNERVALDGYRAWLAAVDALGKGAVKVSPCDRYPVDAASCEAIVTTTAKGPLSSIDPCEAHEKLECFKIDAGDRGVKVVRVGEAGYRDAAGTPLPVGTIVSVSLNSYVIIADQLID